MKRPITFLAIVVAVALAAPVFAAQPDSSGPHFNLNIIGFANCTMTTDGVYPDCFKGNTGPGGHVIFVPLKTSQTDDVCQTADISDSDNDGLVTLAALKKGVRILVTDGDQLEVLDKDATDGTGKFQIPDGCYQIYASAGGKPDGCMDVDTIICADATTLAPEDCDPALLEGQQQYTLVGHINVDRTTGKPKWDNVTNDLLGSGGYLVSQDGYYDFFWQIYNQYLRILHLRIQTVPCD
jgi:type 1 fimbria pilin